MVQCEERLLFADVLSQQFRYIRRQQKLVSSPQILHDRFRAHLKLQRTLSASKRIPTLLTTSTHFTQGAVAMRRIHYHVDILHIPQCAGFDEKHGPFDTPFFIQDIVNEMIQVLSYAFSGARKERPNKIDTGSLKNPHPRQSSSILLYWSM